jgi:hypothetical protein
MLGAINLHGPQVSNNKSDPTYSVKYLGIVDGSMGILSRKMMMQTAQKDGTAGAIDILKANQKI